MADITNYLPAWLVAAAVPAGAVMAFFWKGDEAIGPDMKDWLSRKIVGQTQAQVSTSAERQVSTIDSLLRVFDTVYGTKPNGLPSFLRVALISTAALLIILFNLASIIPSEHFEEVFYPLFQFDFIFALIALTFINVLFDYASVTKALFIMRKIVRFGGVKTISFLLLDFLVTFLIVVLYMFATGLLHAVFVWSGKFLELSGAVLEGGVQLAFFATTFLTFGLTLLYVLAVIVLRFTHGGKMVSSFGSKVRSGISWALPVKTLPVRSIGIVAGLLVFLISLILPLFATT